MLLLLKPVFGGTVQSTIFISGFDLGTARDVTALAGTASIQSSVYRTGGYALQVNPTTTATGQATVRGFDTSTGADAVFSEVNTYVQFYFRYATKPAANSEEIFVARGSSVDKLALRLRSDGKLEAFDSAVSSIGTSSTTLSQDTWYRVAVHVGTGTTAAWDLRINGSSEASGTANLTTSNTQQLRLGKPTNRNGQTIDVFYDDVVADNTAFPADGSVGIMLADGDGTYTAWTIGAGAGSDWQNVDEQPEDSDTTYLLSTLSAGDASSVTLASAAASGISGTVRSVQAMAVCKRYGAANGTLRLRIRSGGTDSDLAGDNSSGSSYERTGRTMDTDPTDSSAWTTAKLDALEVGVIEREATDRTRCTWLGAAVYYTPVAVADAVPQVWSQYRRRHAG